MQPDEHMNNCWFCGKPFAGSTMDPTLIVGGWSIGAILGPKHFHTPRALNTLASQNCYRQIFSTIWVWWMSRTFQPDAHSDTFRVEMDTVDESHEFCLDLLSEWNVLYNLAGGLMKRRRKTASHSSHVWCT